MAWTLAELEEQLLIGSTLVEGSTLTEAEAREVLAGRTVSGHPVRELAELVNYRAATTWLIEQLELTPYVSVDLVTGFHQRLMAGLSEEAGRLKRLANYTIRTDGVRHDYLPPSRTEDALRSWVGDLNDHQPGQPASSAAILYARFQDIHPFEDGNGRVGRIFLAYFLHRHYGLSLRFVAADKTEHLRAIEASDGGDLAPLTQFFSARIRGEA